METTLNSSGSSPVTSQPAKQPNAKPARFEPEAAKISWFKEGIHTDAVIKCADKTWKVHRFVLGTESEFFRNAFARGFKEQEECVVDLQDEDVTGIDEMISFLYHGPPVITAVDRWRRTDDEDEVHREPDSSDEQIRGQIDDLAQWAITAMRNGDFYNVPRLREAALRILNAVIFVERHWGQELYCRPEHRLVGNHLRMETFCFLVVKAFDPAVNSTPFKEVMTRLCAASWPDLAIRPSAVRDMFKERVLTKVPEMPLLVLEQVELQTRDLGRWVYCDYYRHDDALRPNTSWHDGIFRHREAWNMDMRRPCGREETRQVLVMGLLYNLSDVYLA